MDQEAYILSKFPGKAPNMSGKIHARCPFHDDGHASFSIDVSRGLFICGSPRCGVRGNFATFYKLCENIDSWREVYQRLKETSTDFEITDIFSGKSAKDRDFVVNQFPDQVEPIGVIQYLAERGLDRSVIDAYGLVYGISGSYSGISIGGSIVAPVWDLDGQYRTFQVRYLNPTATIRWRNPSDSPIHELLYGAWLVNKCKYLFLVEGASDVWKLFSYGLSAVGLGTKSATFPQLSRILLLCRSAEALPVVCLDGDAPAASDKLYAELFALNLNPKLVKLQFDEDPGNIAQERIEQICRELEG